MKLMNVKRYESCGLGNMVIKLNKVNKELPHAKAFVNRILSTMLYSYIAFSYVLRS